MAVCENGIVRNVSTGTALVMTVRSEACDACGAKGACEIMGGETSNMLVEVEDPIGVRPGQTVEISMETASFLQTTFLTYMVPVIALLAGALLGKYLGPDMGLSETGAAVLGALVLGAAAMFAALTLGRKMGEKDNFRPKIRRIIKSSGVVTTGGDA